MVNYRTRIITSGSNRHHTFGTQIRQSHYLLSSNFTPHKPPPKIKPRKQDKFFLYQIQYNDQNFYSFSSFPELCKEVNYICMAQLKANPSDSILSQSLSPCSRSNKYSKTRHLVRLGSSSKKDLRLLCYNEKNSDKRRRRGWGRYRGGNSALVPFCSSSSTSSSSVELAEEGEDANHGVSEGYLVSEFGWNVRRLVEEDYEMRKVVQVQAEAFHVPVALFDDVFFEFFKAEVLAGLIYKIRNSPPDRYACLVAEPTDPSTSSFESEHGLVGVVDVTVLNNEDVVKHLEGAEEYLYVSGIAVLKEFRRKKVATVLLKACDILSLLWGFEYLALRAYEDDLAARKLYTDAGYRVVSEDPLWMSTWIGRKRRVLMAKRSSFCMDPSKFLLQN